MELLLALATHHDPVDLDCSARNWRPGMVIQIEPDGTTTWGKRQDPRVWAEKMGGPWPMLGRFGLLLAPDMDTAMFVCPQNRPAMWYEKEFLPHADRDDRLVMYRRRREFVVTNLPQQLFTSGVASVSELRVQRL